MKVCVLGLGQVGLPTAKYAASYGFDVWGYDVSDEAIDRAERFNIKAKNDWSKVPLADIYVVCVSTLLSKDNKPDITSVFDVSKKISRAANVSPLVSIESTVPPGTCRKIYSGIFGERIALIHVPHRYWSGDPVRHGVRQMRVIGAINQESLKRGLGFYNELEIPLHITPTIEVAEMSKVAENAYRHVQIAFAEELRMISEELRLNFEEVRRACNSKWNIEILEARDGIKRRCLPMSTEYLISLSAHNVLLRSSTDVDKAYRNWLRIKSKKK